MSEPIPDDELPSYTREELREIRKHEIRMSMEDLAPAIGWSFSTIQRYESGEYKITPDFIRAFEGFRLKLRKERAREQSAQEIDFASADLEPGMELVEMVPKRKSKTTSGLNRIFAAVDREEGGQGGPSKKGRGERTKRALRFGAGAVPVVVLAALILSGQRAILSAIESLGSEGNVAGVRLSASMGDKAGKPVPHGPVPSQPGDQVHMAAPCAKGHTDINGYCYAEMAHQHPPCIAGYFEYEKACYTPVFRYAPAHLRKVALTMDPEVSTGGQAGNEKPPGS